MCISQARSIWGIQLSENLKFRSVYNSKTRNRGNSKLLGRITVIVFNVPSPYICHFSKKNSWSHAIGRLPPNSSNLSMCPFIWNSHLFYIQNFFYFLMAILEAKIFKIQKLFLHLLKSVNNKHTFFEFMSS